MVVGGGGVQGEGPTAGGWRERERKRTSTEMIARGFDFAAHRPDQIYYCFSFYASNPTARSHAAGQQPCAPPATSSDLLGPRPPSRQQCTPPSLTRLARHGNLVVGRRRMTRPTKSVRSCPASLVRRH